MGVHPRQGALGWLWARSEATIPIPGFKTVAQVEENAAALHFGPLSEVKWPTSPNWQPRVMTSHSEVYLINVSGRDRPGLVATVNGVLAQFGVNVLDIGQAVIHEHIALGILAESRSATTASAVMKELLYVAHDLNIQVKFAPVTLEQYEHWVGEQGKERRMITMMGRKLTAAQIAAVAAVSAQHGLNIDVITRLSATSHSSSLPLSPKHASNSL